MVDQSGSMTEKIVFAGAEMPKSRAVSLAASSFIDELIHRARRDDGIRDYYDLAVLGYGEPKIESLISPAGMFTTPSCLAAKRVERTKIMRERLLPSGRSAIAVTEQNLWIGQRAQGSTPMCAALESALKLVEKWCRQPKNARSYPPTVINITDGETSDGSADDIRAIAARIRATGTDDGGTILINIHLARAGSMADGLDSGVSAISSAISSTLSSVPSSAIFPAPVLFPTLPDELPDHRYARLLWEISSPLPANFGGVHIVDFPDGVPAETDHIFRRGVAFNTGIAELAAAMNIGSVNSVMI
jgi:hypothetical protein